jgi:hypothetical protein
MVIWPDTYRRKPSAARPHPCGLTDGEGFRTPCRVMVPVLRSPRRGTMWASSALRPRNIHMTKKRTTAQQRAREIQHAPGSRLTYGRALETARRPLDPDQAREVLRALVEDEHQEVSASWRDQLRGHLSVTRDADWPSLEHAVELCDDLFRLTGLPAPEVACWASRRH